MANLDPAGIEERYRRGVPIRRIMEDCNITKLHSLYRLLPSDCRRIKAVGPEVRDQIFSHPKAPVRAIATKFGVSKTTVHRIRTSGDRDWHAEDIDEPEEVVFHAADWRCPEHGVMSVHPCPACEAIKAKRNKP